jgi:hypothetical protein
MKLTVTQQTCASSLVETNETEILDDPHRRAFRRSLNAFGDFTLDLQSDFDNLERVREYLKCCVRTYLFDRAS